MDAIDLSPSASPAVPVALPISVFGEHVPQLINIAVPSGTSPSAPSAVAVAAVPTVADLVGGELSDVDGPLQASEPILGYTVGPGYIDITTPADYIDAVEVAGGDPGLLTFRLVTADGSAAYWAYNPVPSPVTPPPTQSTYRFVGLRSAVDVQTVSSGSSPAAPTAVPGEGASSPAVPVALPIPVIAEHVPQLINIPLVMPADVNAVDGIVLPEEQPPVNTSQAPYADATQINHTAEIPADTHSFVNVTMRAAAVTLDLPESPASGLNVWICDSSAQAADYPITVDAGANSILDFGSQYTITRNLAVLHLRWDEANWKVL
jgi:hypothetical protein